VRVRRRAASATPQARPEDNYSPQLSSPSPLKPTLQRPAPPIGRKADEQEQLEEFRSEAVRSVAVENFAGEVDDARQGKPKSLREERWEERRRAHMERIACGGAEVVRVGGRASKVQDEHNPAEERQPFFAVPTPSHKSDRAEHERPSKASQRASSEGANVRRPPSQSRRTPPVRYDIIANRWINA